MASDFTGQTSEFQRDLLRSGWSSAMYRMGLKLCTKGRVIEAQANTVTSEEKLRGGIRW